MNRSQLVSLLFICIFCIPAASEMLIDDHSNGRLVYDEDRPVLQIDVAPDSRTGGDGARIEYIFDLYGDVYPEKAYADPTHRGLKWDTGQLTHHRGDGSADPIRTVRAFERWSFEATDESTAVLDVQSAWLNASSGEAILTETVRIMASKQDVNKRYIDVRIRWVNVSLATIEVPVNDRARPLLQFGFDPEGTNLKFLDEDGPIQRVSSASRSDWLAWTTMSPREFAPVGMAVFPGAIPAAAAKFSFQIENSGRIACTIPDAGDSFVLAPEDFTELEFRIFCYMGDQPTFILAEEYLRYSAIFR